MPGTRDWITGTDREDSGISVQVSTLFPTADAGRMASLDPRVG
jgi:hypothetical protein